jgi:hypothetical protein
MDKRTVYLSTAQARQTAHRYVDEAPADWVMVLKPKTRSLDQNARLHAMLADISRQVDWYGRKLTPEAWKRVFSAALKKQDVVPGLNGDFVVIGVSTSEMSIKEMGELMELMEAFGAERGVVFGAQE